MRRHWYPLADRYLGRFVSAATMIARLLESISPLRPSTHHYAAPEPLDELSSIGHDIDQFVSYADEEIRRSERTIAELSHRVRELEDRIVDYSIDHQLALEELATVTEESEILHRRVAYYRDLLEMTGQSDDFVTTREAVVTTPAIAANSTDAVEKAQYYLSDRLVIPDSALHDLEKLDAAVNYASLGQLAWKGFRALHAYADALARDPETSSFWYWCKNSHHPLIWPASANKLSMKESNSVHRNEKLRAQRVLPVATEVSENGFIFMEAHLKIAKGGGQLAPRIYFYVDTPRARVHVGYFGPHYNMDNTRS
ncbi:hypothetical protein [Nocardia sp. Marseille-Q1738]